MKLISSLSDSLDIFDALNSQLRIDIIKLLLENHEMNMTDIATHFGISKGTLTPHIKKLESAGLVGIRLLINQRGPTKLCRIIEDKIIIEVMPEYNEYKSFETEINVGQYFDFSVTPTCGLASTKNVIGTLDDPRYFSDPCRFDAGMLWFTQGYVLYKIPNLLSLNSTAEEVQISLELCSEAPGVVANYPSDIYFTLNGCELGFWTSPGELYDRPGRYTPSWWYKNFPQYGRIKVITINHNGTYLDGLLLSSVTIDNLNLNNSSELSLKIEVPLSAKNIGGMNLFGKGFGDYDCGIKFKVLYSDKTGA